MVIPCIPLRPAGRAAYCLINFQLPFSTRTSTRDLASSPVWSVGDMVNTPCEAGTSRVASSAARKASRNSWVPGFAFFSASPAARRNRVPASQAWPPKVER